MADAFHQLVQELGRRHVRFVVIGVAGANYFATKVDLTLVMAGHDFETVWNERRIFLVEGVEIPVARLTHIVRSKAAVGRDKDRLFLATHADALKQLLGRD